MGLMQRFERRLEGLVGDAFARVFGGNVVPQEVAQALQREADTGVRPLAGGRLLAPNRYTVTLGAADHSRLSDDAQRVIQLLRDCVGEHIRERGWETYGGVLVDLERSETLHTGQFRTSSSVDPDVSPSVPAQPRAGDPAMSQRHRDEPEQHTRRNDDGHSGYEYPDNPGYGYGGYGYGPTHGYERGYAAQYGYAQDAAPSHDQRYPTRGYDGSDGSDGDYAPAVDGGYGPPPGVAQGAASLVIDDGSSRRYQLAHGGNVVGRGQDAQFRLPDTGVSRRHLEISWDGRNAVLADLGSTNGTRVNDTPVQRWQLADGDVVQVGYTRLIFRSHG